MRTLRTLGALALLCLLAPAAARAASLQPIGNFEKPIYVTSDPGNPERLFVVERAGRILEVREGTTSVFADLRAAVGCTASSCKTGVDERGLLSVAPAPDFDTTGRFYVDYANGTTGVIHVAELLAGGALRDVLTIEHAKGNHNGGQIQFGPEGLLFIATGDGGGSDDELENAQSKESLLGKILRIDPRPSGVLQYTIPASNPFVGKEGRDEIWSYGLRNPYRFSFDRLTGAIAIGDVGQDNWEEVDYAPAPGLGGGADYGWNCREGFEAETVPPESGCFPPPAAGFVDPIFAYPHENPGNGGGPFGCAIVGGYLVRDPALGDLYGRYLYGDYCNPELRSLIPALPTASGDRSEGLEVDNLVSFGEDSCGRLYTVSELGQVSRLIGAQPTACFAPGTVTQLKVSFAGIRALRRRVPRGDKALLTAFVSPCAGRRGEPVKLFRNRVHVATRHLDRACTARFRQKIGRRLKFQVTIHADDTYQAASSRKLGIKPKPRHRKH
jgi:hypothetical protein